MLFLFGINLKKENNKQKTLKYTLKRENGYLHQHQSKK